jgi:hypothetical protein
MSRMLRFTAALVRPSDATQYAAGDEIASSATAGSVVRPTLDLSGYRKARIQRVGCDVTPASSNLVITAFDFALLVSKTADAVAAVGDNVALSVTGAQRNKAAKFVFANGAWTNPAGALTAGTSGFQEVLPNVATAGEGNLFDFSQGDALIATRTLSLVLQATGVWNPGAVVNTFNFAFDIEVE